MSLLVNLASHTSARSLKKTKNVNKTEQFWRKYWVGGNRWVSGVKVKLDRILEMEKNEASLSYPLIWAHKQTAATQAFVSGCSWKLWLYSLYIFTVATCPLFSPWDHLVMTQFAKLIRFVLGASGRLQGCAWPWLSWCQTAFKHILSVSPPMALWMWPAYFIYLDRALKAVYTLVFQFPEIVLLYVT